MAFIIFTVAVSVLRRQFARMGDRTNVPKEIRKRFQNVFGSGNNQARVDDVDNHGMGGD